MPMLGRVFALSRSYRTDFITCIQPSSLTALFPPRWTKIHEQFLRRFTWVGILLLLLPLLLLSRYYRARFALRCPPQWLFLLRWPRTHFAPRKLGPISLLCWPRTCFVSSYWPSHV
ncbi:hypothetical protein BU23DRAFT_310202 [Bimuria novae-zelandiae CBS 107.79]|uniref:Uncharacterized protein n=1 Tax=Bimuria novae-zelandiae CBS 107.79 TaxID=1447943 RepID=A0A6A5UNQ1_9PLEO|nr:hypothetical protein BU23DRAFT_310202 [Bimuria novae-zelandiae CBS 107.79]